MSDELGYATRLLQHFVAEHCPHNPDWKPLPDLIGVLTQFDNVMVIARDYKSRIEALETALREIIEECAVDSSLMGPILRLARAALAKEAEK
jgi:hypothetical protein